ncbi:Multiple coagulation factor deficiency protein 2-like protein [Leptotrombidium deliense]|uniref:Multiple coagulation factor deficiency protein 2-like protein n=1 Tax=Leptotrombidium deliense TaxID=299467 RepID=A0A443SH93_9ACAR|nr:Multiple coagulation factor deficiency protein 2-like protein [Leptotrombidium deliense]
MNARVFIFVAFIGFTFTLVVECHTHGEHKGHDGKKRKPLWNYYGKAEIDLDHVLEETKHVIKLQEDKKITQQDAAFYFHRLHDFNTDGYLDGLELLHAVKHSLIYSNTSLDMSNLESLEKTVDTQLKFFDYNGDGLVEYSELMKCSFIEKKTAVYTPQLFLPLNKTRSFTVF